MKKIMMVLLAAVAMSACGIKPGQVEGDPGHPATYPDERLDPLPNGGISATSPRP